MPESPSPFIARWVTQIAPRDTSPMAALDLAMGSGRHTLLLAEAGFKTFGVDRNVESLQQARAEARRRDLNLRIWAADLEQTLLPVGGFALVVCTRYLQRTLFRAIRDTVKPGGLVLYETFTVLQLRHGVGPRSPDHLLHPNELRTEFSGWNVLEYEEAARPEALARLAARKPEQPG